MHEFTKLPFLVIMCGGEDQESWAELVPMKVVHTKGCDEDGTLGTCLHQENLEALHDIVCYR